MTKNILITGSSQGIGLAIAKHFAKDFNVYITGRYAQKLEKLCKEYNFKGFAAVNLTHEDAAETLLNEVGFNIDILY